MRFWPILVKVIYSGRKDRYHTEETEYILEASKEVSLEMNPEKL
jgi:hypothetical protein